VIAKGAQPTDRVARLLDGLGVAARAAQQSQTGFAGKKARNPAPLLRRLRRWLADPAAPAMIKDRILVGRSRSAWRRRRSAAHFFTGVPAPSPPTNLFR
jgi:hypothetical protein